MHLPSISPLQPQPQISYSLIGLEDADVFLQAKKVGQVHGCRQVPRGVYKLPVGRMKWGHRDMKGRTALTLGATHYSL